MKVSRRAVEAALRFYEAAKPDVSACALDEVPPWRFLKRGVAVDQAAADAAVALGIREHWAIIGLFWDMRRYSNERFQK